MKGSVFTGPAGVALTCRGGLLVAARTSSFVTEYLPRGAWPTACRSKPPATVVALGPPKIVPSGRAVTATIACPGKGCSVRVGLEPAPRCRGCIGIVTRTRPRLVRLPDGGIAHVTFPLGGDALARIASGATLAVRLEVSKGVTVRGGGPVPLKLPTSLSLGCSPSAGTVRLRGRASGIPVGAVVALTITGGDGAQQGVLVRAGLGGRFAGSVAAPSPGRWIGSASFDGAATRSEAVSGICSATVKAAKPAPALPPAPTPAPAPAPTPAPTPSPAPPSAATLTLSCSAGGDPATGSVTLQAHGVLSPAQAGRTVTVSFETPGQPAKTATATTNVDGGFSASAPAAPGSWSAKAAFSGDAAAGAAAASAGCG